MKTFTLEDVIQALKNMDGEAEIAFASELTGLPEEELERLANTKYKVHNYFSCDLSGDPVMPLSGKGVDSWDEAEKEARKALCEGLYTVIRNTETGKTVRIRPNLCNSRPDAEFPYTAADLE